MSITAYGVLHTHIVTLKHCLYLDRFLYYWPFENSWLGASAWVNDIHIPSQGMVKTDRQSSKFPCIKEKQLAARLSNHLIYLSDFLYVYFSKIPVTLSGVKRWEFCLFGVLWVCLSLEIASAYIFNILPCFPPDVYKLWCKLFIRWTSILIGLAFMSFIRDTLHRWRKLGKSHHSLLKHEIQIWNEI